MNIPPALPPRPAFRDRLRTIYINLTMAGALLFLVLACGVPLWAINHTIDRRKRLARRTVRRIYGGLLRHYTRIAGCPLVVENTAVNWPEVGPCIVVANHASAMDVIVLMQLPRGAGDGRVWAKRWPFETLLLGTLMRLCGHLHVDDFNILPDAQESLSQGESLLVFPESSRSRTGKLCRFRDGAFLVAARTGMPIVPVAIHGSHACFPPGQPWIFRPIIRVQVLGVLRVKTGLEDRAHLELKRRAFGMIEAALKGKAEQIGAESVAA